MSKFMDLVFYLGNMHYASDSVFKFIKYVLSQNQDLNVMMVMTFNMDIMEFDEESKTIDSFIEIAEEQDMLVRIDSDFYSEDMYIQPEMSSEKVMMQKLIENYEFLAIDDCIHHGKTLYIEYNNRMDSAHIEHYILLLKLLGKTHYLLKDKEAAFFYDNMALSLATEHKNTYEMCDIKIRLGYDYAIRGEFQIARKYAQDGSYEARELKNRELMYKCMLLNFKIDKEGLYIDARSNNESLDELINATIERGYDNYLSMIYTNPNELHDNFNSLKKERFYKGLEIAMKNGNDHQLSEGYHNMGIVYSRMGEIEKAYEYYIKSQYLKEQIGDKKRIAYIYNSLGYYYFLTELHELSHMEYLKSFSASTDSRDYYEVGMTLFNMAMNTFIYGKYKEVCGYMVKLLKLMKISRIDDLKYHSKKTIYDLYIISLYKSGQISKANDVYNKLKIWGLKQIEGKTEEYFLTQMMEFFMASNSELAEEILIGAEEYIPKGDESMMHFRKFYYIEKSLYLKKRNTNEYRKVIKTFRRELVDKYSKETIIKLNDLYNKKDLIELEEPKGTLVDIDNDFDRTLYTAKIDQNFLKLRNRINEISFLNLVQNMLINEDDINDVIIRFQKLIHGNTKVEKIFCRMPREDGYNELNLENPELVISEVYAERIFTYIGDKTRPTILQLGNANLMTIKKSYGYSSLMYIPIYVKGKRQVELIFMTQRHHIKLNQDDLSVFSLVARQVGENMERITNNKALHATNLKLEHLSRTDLLTGLNNRNSLESELQKEKQRVKNGETTQLIIMFIDLDNFKYYNDTFGHNIGDQVLIYFANILKDVVDKHNYVARFGGDEFVILLKNVDKKEAQKTAHKIYSKIKEFHYFEKIIGHIKGEQVIIPNAYRLSCSIGMSSFDDCDSRDVDVVLKRSDEALYNAKRAGKNQLSKAGELELC